MRSGFLNITWVSLYFLIASAASPRDKYRGVADHLPEVLKNGPADYRKEPSCDELRAMWRFSKRQGRTAENTNEIPTHRDPFAYNMWEDQASIRSVGGGKIRRPLIYGRLVHSVAPRPRFQESTPERIRAFEEVARMFGTSGHLPKIQTGRKPTAIRVVGGRDGLGPLPSPMQGGSFQHLKEIIQSERARELHEQKMSEENAVRESALQYQRMVQDYQGDRDDLGARARSSHKGRSRGHMDRVIGYPGYPSKYGTIVYSNMNYMPRSYQGPMNIEVVRV